jgi:hypothetical protein
MTFCQDDVHFKAVCIRSVFFVTPCIQFPTGSLVLKATFLCHPGVLDEVGTKGLREEGLYNPTPTLRFFVAPIKSGLLQNDIHLKREGALPPLFFTPLSSQ